jgi:hypothetical protein
MQRRNEQHNLSDELPRLLASKSRRKPTARTSGKTWLPDLQAIAAKRKAGDLKGHV